MKEKTLFTCEVCHTDYANKKDAENCEAHHTTKLKVIKPLYRAYQWDHCGMPEKVVIPDKDGKEYVYKRLRKL